MTDCAAIVLAAGMGTRMKSRRPKVLHPLAGRPMILHLLDTVRGLGVERIAVVVAPGMQDVAATVEPASTAVQGEALGTGHAVLAARELLAGFAGDVLILFGDTPLVSDRTLRKMLDARAAPDRPAVVVLGMRPAGPNEYGRLVPAADGSLDAIVEFRDASEEQRGLPLCNSGVMAVDGGVLFELLDKVENRNAKGEYYLTDIVAVARGRGLRCAVVEGSEEELLGINSRIELAGAEAIVQRRLREQAMLNGATLLMPESVHFSWDTRIGRDVTIGPFVSFAPGVEVGDGVEIKGFCHFEGTSIAEDAIVGPYARLRPGAEIGAGAHIGNFVEVKKAVVERGAKVNHLSYIGDARVGEKANVGAGTITCNYDGFAKHHTDIGAGAFIGSNTALVAPVAIGDGAFVGAGSTITQDVPADALAVERADSDVREGWARRYREKKQKRR